MANYMVGIIDEEELVSFSRPALGRKWELRRIRWLDIAFFAILHSSRLGHDTNHALTRARARWTREKIPAAVS